MTYKTIFVRHSSNRAMADVMRHRFKPYPRILMMRYVLIVAFMAVSSLDSGNQCNIMEATLKYKPNSFKKVEL